ncbi:alpha-L-rhamnosidase [Brachybacterium sp. YJGR34]|uniref:alpha-L-rhamnosidase n=1 Tax=Brachybacterium sp. YJGR34 TaxID=2059911 RepID=UPI000E0B81DC|nr:alpha-L-rhamnosidase [Brachybacterium sp. YJGR34]
MTDTPIDLCRRDGTPGPALAAPVDLAAEYRARTGPVATPLPRLSWRVPDAPVSWTPGAAEIELLGCSGESGEADGPPSTAQVAASGVLVDWPFAPLVSGERVRVRVRVRGSDGSLTPWSEEMEILAGLFAPEDWTVPFVAAPWVENTRIDQSPPILRGELRLRGPVRRANLAVTSLGLHEVMIEGVRVGDEELAPGWTSYGHRLRYLMHDVTDLLPAGGGTVTVGARLGDGWYRGRLTWDDRVRNVYGETLAVLAQLSVEYADGTSETLGTDAAWTASRGGILLSGLYDGERWDGSEEPEGWARTGFDDAGWDPVRVVPTPDAELVPYEGPAVRAVEEIAPVSVRRGDAGSLQLDFGQNLPGRLRLRNVEVGPFGLTLRHAEVVQDGELSTRPLRTAKATDIYLSGPQDDGTSSWEPRFTVHGFRYAELEGWPGGELADGDVVARVMHSDMERTGSFHCSDPRLEQLHANVVWSMRGNFVDVPTDCPQRDERLGWTGDLQVFTPTAAFLYDCAGVLRSWLRDLSLEQYEDGGIPFYVPTLPEGDPPVHHAAVWGDVAVLTPWALFMAFGDADLLAGQWDSARSWVDGVLATSDAQLQRHDGFEFGDWLDPTAPPEDAAAAKADKYCVASCYSYRSTSVLARWATALGKEEDAQRYAALARRIKEGWSARWLTEDGVVRDDSQTSSALAIVFGLVDPTGPVGVRLAELVRENGHRIGTGFAGTPVICDALSQSGHLEDAYAMLATEECPSWLYPVSQGATTIWERWDSVLPSGRVNSGGMTSFNHYALGSVADFLHRVVAGIEPLAPGYERIRFAPRPGGALTHAGAALTTPRGRAAIDWRLEGGEGDRRLEIEVTVPVGATALLDLPQGAVELGHGSWSVATG